MTVGRKKRFPFNRKKCPGEPCWGKSICILLRLVNASILSNITWCGSLYTLKYLDNKSFVICYCMPAVSDIFSKTINMSIWFSTLKLWTGSFFWTSCGCLWQVREICMINKSNIFIYKNQHCCYEYDTYEWILSKTQFVMCEPIDLFSTRG